MESHIECIAEILFKDTIVKVYFDEHRHRTESDTIGCVWQIRNPDSCYTGVVYMNHETGKFTYPDDAIIPVQTESDLEMLPKFILV